MKKLLGVFCITACAACMPKHILTSNSIGIVSGVIGYLAGLVMLFGED